MILARGVRCLRLIAISALFAGVAHGAEQAYPVRPVRIIVSNATGSSPEITGRILANKLTAQTGQQFVVDTRPGASGIIGVELVKTATPDGYTLLVGSTTVFSSLPALKPNLLYDMERDFVPLTRIASVANVMVVQASLGVASVAEFIQYAQANPDIVLRMTAAFMWANAKIQRDREEVRETARKTMFPNLPEAVYREAFDFTYPCFALPTDRFTQPAFERVLRVANLGRKAAGLPQVTKIAMDDIMTNRFLEAAAPAVSKLPR